jgi:hypothetical protein
VSFALKDREARKRGGGLLCGFPRPYFFHNLRPRDRESRCGAAVWIWVPVSHAAVQAVRCAHSHQPPAFFAEPRKLPTNALREAFWQSLRGHHGKRRKPSSPWLWLTCRVLQRRSGMAQRRHWSRNRIPLCDSSSPRWHRAAYYRTESATTVKTAAHPAVKTQAISQRTIFQFRV